jgi:hypothetical protein
MMKLEMLQLATREALTIGVSTEVSSSVVIYAVVAKINRTR